MAKIRPKLGRHAAVWGGFNKINKLTRRAAPASEARGGANLTPYLPRGIAISLKRPYIASKSKSRLATPLFYGRLLNHGWARLSP